MSCDEEFNETVLLMKRISSMSELMNDLPEEIAKIYALHQKATKGVATDGDKHLVSQQVWDEWMKMDDIPTGDAKNRYIEMVKKLEKTLQQSENLFQAEVAESTQGAKTVSSDLLPLLSKSADAPVVSSDLVPSVSETADAKLVSSDLYPPL